MSSENFVKLYKNTGKPEDLRRRRTETSVELRKQKGNEEMMKRRNLQVDLENESYTSGSDTEDKDNNRAAPQLLSVEEAAEVLKTNPSMDQIKLAFESVRRTLSRSKEPPIDLVIKLGFQYALVQAMAVQDEKVQFEAAWALTNIVSGTSEQTWAVVQAGAIGPLLKLGTSESKKLAEQAIWAVANIAGDGVKLRDMLIAEGGVQIFVNLAKRAKQFGPSFVRTLTWAISNLCRHKKPPAPYEVLAQLAPAIASLLRYEDMETQMDACWALSYLTDGPDENIQLAQGIVPDMVAFISSGQDKLITPALRVMGNFATGNDELTQAVIDSDILTGAIPQLMLSNNSSFVKECCWLISNVLAGNPQQIQDVIDAQLLPMLFNVLEKGEHRLQYESGWAVANLAHGGTANQVLEICRVKNGIEAICTCLGTKNNELVANMLDSLYQTLYTVSTFDPENLAKICERVEECNGLDKLEALQQHGSEKIYGMAYKCIDEFFHDEQEDGLDVLKSAAGMHSDQSMENGKNVSFNF